MYKIKNRDKSIALHTLTQCIKMLPLVRKIAEDMIDLVSSRKILANKMDNAIKVKPKALLTWQERQQIYADEEIVNSTDRKIEECAGELAALGLHVLDEKIGQVGFPTIVNNGPAYFCWNPQCDTVLYWRKTNEAIDRPVPPAWYKQG